MQVRDLGRGLCRRRTSSPERDIPRWLCGIVRHPVPKRAKDRVTSSIGQRDRNFFGTMLGLDLRLRFCT